MIYSNKKCVLLLYLINQLKINNHLNKLTNYIIFCKIEKIFSKWQLHAKTGWY